MEQAIPKNKEILQNLVGKKPVVFSGLPKQYKMFGYKINDSENTLQIPL